jgi:hypothetical protein
MATDETLLELLTALEVELHQPQTRRDRVRLGQLLHDGFREFGRSGRVYSRAEVIGEFAEDEPFPQIVASGFELQVIGPNAALLTYVSAHRSDDGGVSRLTLRSSIWVRTAAAGWQMAFHQGTPTEDTSVPTGI